MFPSASVLLLAVKNTSTYFPFLSKNPNGNFSVSCPPIPLHTRIINLVRASWSFSGHRTPKISPGSILPMTSCLVLSVSFSMAAFHSKQQAFSSEANIGGISGL
uniref:Phytochrome n=1 Tax=Rhizophora mucronata TaxID=61149 RepID=A0A2P2J1P5_RHIMU